MKKIFFLVLINITGILFAETLQTKQPTNYLREGPASYYNVIAALSRGVNVEVLERQGSWFRVKAFSDTGWISENSFFQPGNAQEQNENMLKGKVSSRASRAELAAAVKGFANKYTGSNDAEDIVPSKYDATNISKDEMEKLEHSFVIVPFKNNLNIEKPFDINLHEEEIGFGIAEKIAQQKKLYDAPNLTRYVNSIGTYLSQFTKAYDLGFRIMILNDMQACAFSCPGGYIFISRALISTCRNEAELAAVIAHEMAHCIQRHGLKELKLSTPKIHAEQSFDELDEEAGGQSDVEKELEEDAAAIYDNIIAPRLLTYELEADQLSMIYLERAGYDPTALVSLLERINNASLSGEKQQENPYFQKNDIKKRLSSASNFCQEESLTPDTEKQFEDRFINRTVNMQ
ncbi:MAG: M48 family metalloprotease [Bacteroidota bacterium]